MLLSSCKLYPSTANFFSVTVILSSYRCVCRSLFYVNWSRYVTAHRAAEFLNTTETNITFALLNMQDKITLYACLLYVHSEDNFMLQSFLAPV